MRVLNYVLLSSVLGAFHDSPITNKPNITITAQRAWRTVEESTLMVLAHFCDSGHTCHVVTLTQIDEA